jgi:AraC-like DNA-binding protein
LSLTTDQTNDKFKFDFDPHLASESPFSIFEYLMAFIPLIRISVFLPIVDFLNHIGSPTDRLLSQANLYLSPTVDPEGFLPLYQSSEFLENMARLEGIEDLGLLIGQKTSFRKLGQLGSIAYNTLTLFDLLTTLEQTVSLANSGGQCTLRWEKDWVWVQYRCKTPNAQTPNLQTQCYNLMLYLDAVRMALGPAWKPSELYLACPPCQAILSMEDFSEAYIHFMMPHNAIKIPRAALSLPINRDTSLGVHTPPDYENFYQSAPARELIDSCHQLILSLLPNSYPEVTVVAKAAGMSVRSLQRQLAEEGLTYSRLVEQVRYDQAVKLLKRPDLKLIEIAADLGYTDPANFTRAFKRWTGVSPKEFRVATLD